MTDSDASSGSEGLKLSKELTVKSKLGIHARPAAMIVRIASAYPCEVWIEKDGEEVNGKSIMGIMMLAAGQGSKLKFVVEGEGADKVLEDMEALFEGEFQGVDK